jgi:hypothetical protein
VQVVFIRAADGLVALCGRRVGVEEDAEVVSGIATEDDVVVLGAFGFDQAEVRSLESYAVFADEQVGRQRLVPAIGEVAADGVVAG